MHQVNIRGTFLCSKLTLPHLLKAENPHILNIAPPLDLAPKWFAGHVAYTMAKYGMSLCTLGMAEEFRLAGIAVNSLWPLTMIDTAAVRLVLGGDDMARMARFACHHGRCCLCDLDPTVTHLHGPVLHRRRGASSGRRNGLYGLRARGRRSATRRGFLHPG